MCFMSWLNALRDIIGLNLERYRRTRDREYRRDVSGSREILVDLANRHWMIYDHLWLMWNRTMLMYGTGTVIDEDDSKSSGYNVGIFDDVDVAGDDPNHVTTDSNNLSSTYAKHVESRGAYALRHGLWYMKRLDQTSMKGKANLWYIWRLEASLNFDTDMGSKTF